MVSEKQAPVLMDLPDVFVEMAEAYRQFVALLLSQPYSTEGWAEQKAIGMFEAWVSQQAEHGRWFYYHEKEKAKRLVEAS